MKFWGTLIQIVANNWQYDSDYEVEEQNSLLILEVITSVFHWRSLGRNMRTWGQFEVLEIINILLMLLSFFVRPGVWTQGLVLAGLALHHFHHTPSPFFFSCFFKVLHVFPGCSGRDLCFPCLCNTTPSHWLRWGPMNFLPRLASNCEPPDLHLPHC
jgi:hypothetical protein